MTAPAPLPRRTSLPVPSPAPRRPSGPAAVSLALLALTLAGCARGQGQQRRADGGAVPVTLGQAVRKTVPVQLRAIGQVEPMRAVAVRSRVSGELQRVAFAEGDLVAQGQVLFEIDPRPARAALAQAEAQLARDRAQLVQAQADVARYASLVAQGLVTRQQHDQAEAAAAAARALVAAEEAAVENARLQVGYCTVTAPVSGRTGLLQVKQGNLVQAGGSQVLVTVNQTRPIQVSFAVPALHLPAIRAPRGRSLPAEAVPVQTRQAPARGTLSFVDNAVDTATSTVLLKATFPNADETLWPGQLVDVTLRLGEEPDRVVVPSGAVQTGQQGTYVYVVGPDQKAELRAVEVARQDAVEAVVAKGLDGTETVVTDGQLRLVPGARVQARPAAGPAGEGAPEGGKAPAGPAGKAS